MSDVDKIQAAEEAVAQMEEQKRRDEQDKLAADLAQEPVEETADKPRRSAHIALSQMVARDNIRTELTNVHDLAKSIRERGLITPLLVRPDEDQEDRYVIVAGHRRHAALTQLHGDSELLVPVEIIDDLDEGEIFALMLTENEQREPLEPLQAARAARHLLDLRPGMTVAELARSLGLRDKWLVSRFKLLDLPKEVQEHLDAGNLSFTIADMLRKGQKAGRIDEEKAKSLADKVASGEITTAEVRKVAAPATPPPKTVKQGENGELLDEDGSVRPEHWTPEIAEEVERRQREAAGQKLVEQADDFLAHAEAAAKAGGMTDLPFDMNGGSTPAPTTVTAPAERVHSSADAVDETNPLRQRLHGYTVGRMLRDWASDEYLESVGVEREDALSHAEKLAHGERTELMYHLAAALMGAENQKG